MGKEQVERIIMNDIMRKEMAEWIATTSKIPVAPDLLKEEKFTFQRKIIWIVNWQKFLKELIINFDQTPLSYITVGSITLEFSGAQSLPLMGKEKRKQITGTFSIPAAGKFHLRWEELTLPS